MFKSEEQAKLFNPGDEVVIRPVNEWIWQVHYPDHIEGARGTILDKQAGGCGRLVIQFDEDDYKELGLGEAIPDYLWEKGMTASPRTAHLRPRQIRKLDPEEEE